MIKDLVENPHKIHKSYCPYWNFLLDSYEGGVDYTQAQIVSSTMINASTGITVMVNGQPLKSTVQNHLFKHPKEKDNSYTERLQMSYYYNFCSPIIDIYTNHLFKHPINEEFKGLDTIIKERKTNIDRQGNSIAEFRAEMAELSQLYGHIFVMSDMPRVVDGKQIRTFKDKIDNKLFPYLTLIHPQNVINWALDEFGEPYWVLIKEVVDTAIDPDKYDKSKLINVRYRLWTRTNWTIYDSDYAQIDTGVHGLGYVPISCVFDKKSKKYKNFLGISTIADIAFITRDIYNSCSELKQILRDQTFAFLAIQGSADEYNDLTVGTSKALLYPEDRNKPEYISPPPANAEVYFKHIDRQISKIYQLAKLEGGSGSYKGERAIEQSGVSKAWDFNETNSSLSKKAANLEDGETRIWQKYALWEKKKFEGTISYPKEFSMQSLFEDLEEAEKAIKISLGNEFNKEIKKAIVKKKFPRMPEDKIKVMLDDIDNNEKGEGLKLIDRMPELFEKENK